MKSLLGEGALLLALVVSFCSLPALASAQGSREDEEARTHFESGRLYFERGAYEESLREFQAAYELSHRAELLYNLYLTTERLGEWDQAISYLEHYLAEGSPDAERRASLEPRLENLRARRDRHAAPDEPDATPTDATPAPTPSTQTVHHDGDLIPAIAAFAVAGAGLVSWAILGGLALSEDGNLTSTCGRSCTSDQTSTLGALTLGADISWITAAVAGVTGLVLLFTVGQGHDETVSTARVMPWVAPNGASGGLSISGSF